MIVGNFVSIIPPHLLFHTSSSHVRGVEGYTNSWRTIEEMDGCEFRVLPCYCRCIVYLQDFSHRLHIVALVAIPMSWPWSSTYCISYCQTHLSNRKCLGFFSLPVARVDLLKMYLKICNMFFFPFLLTPRFVLLRSIKIPFHRFTLPNSQTKTTFTEGNNKNKQKRENQKGNNPESQIKQSSATMPKSKSDTKSATASSSKAAAKSKTARKPASKKASSAASEEPQVIPNAKSKALPASKAKKASQAPINNAPHLLQPEAATSAEATSTEVKALEARIKVLEDFIEQWRPNITRWLQEEEIAEQKYQAQKAAKIDGPESPDDDGNDYSYGKSGKAKVKSKAKGTASGSGVLKVKTKRVVKTGGDGAKGRVFKGAGKVAKASAKKTSHRPQKGVEAPWSESAGEEEEEDADARGASGANAKGGESNRSGTEEHDDGSTVDNNLTVEGYPTVEDNLTVDQNSTVDDDMTVDEDLTEDEAGGGVETRRSEDKGNENDIQGHENHLVNVDKGEGVEQDYRSHVQAGNNLDHPEQQLKAAAPEPSQTDQSQQTSAKAARVSKRTQRYLARKNLKKARAFSPDEDLPAMERSSEQSVAFEAQASGSTQAPQAQTATLSPKANKRKRAEVDDDDGTDEETGTKSQKL